MTWNRQSQRNLMNYIDNKSDKNSVRNRWIGEGIVNKISDRSKIAIVQILPENIEIACRVKFSKAGNGTQDGSMPKVGTRVLLAFLNTQSDIYEDVVIMGEIFDDNNVPPTRTSGAENDTKYHAINPENGGKIEFYKDGDDVHRLFITSLGKIDINCIDDFNIVVDGDKKFNVSCENISLGDPNLTNTNDLIVKKPHLDNHNAMANAVSDILTNLSTQMLIGDLGIPLPITVRIPTYIPAVKTPYEVTKTSDIIDNDNITGKTRAT